MAAKLLTVAIALALLLLNRSSTSNLVNNSETSSKNKQDEIAMLVLLPITGDAPRSGEACRIAIEVMLKEINKRQDILPGYHLTAIYKDEGEQAALSTAAVMSFKRETGIYQSPIVIGPYFSRGCLTLANHIQYYDMVLLALSCTSPIATSNRKTYPNLYRTKSSGELAAFAQLHFMRDIGKWNRFGILTNDGYLFDYTVATFLNKIAKEEGFDVSFFEGAPDANDEVIAALKESDTRVIIVDTSVAAFAIQFLCQTYKFGMTGPAYVFLIHMAAAFEPNTDFAGCSREIIFEQFKYVFWVGWRMTPFLAPVNSTFLSLENFELEFDKFTNGTPPADYNKRLNCADAALQAALALDKSEQILSNKNMSLKDYTRNGQEIVEIVNNSLAKTDFTSFRIGRFKYSARLELDNDSQEVTQWQPDKGATIRLCRITVTTESAIYNYSGYKFAQHNNTAWYTKNGQPPKDDGSIYSKINATSLACFIVLFISFVTLTGLQIGSLVKMIFNPTSGWDLYSLGIKLQSIWSFGVGCCFLNISGILFLISAAFQTPQSFCIVQRVLFITSFAIVDGFAICRMTAFRATKTFRQKIVKPPYNMFFANRNDPLPLGPRDSNLPIRRESHAELAPRSSAPINHHQNVVRASDAIELFVLERRRTVPSLTVKKEAAHRCELLKLDLRTNRGMAAWTGICAIFATVWMASETPTISVTTRATQLTSSNQQAAYDVQITQTFVCKSANDSAWMISLVVLHVILLCLASFLSFELRHNQNFLEVHQDFCSVRLALVNVTTLIIGGALVLTVTPSPIDQLVVISVFTLLISGITFGIIFKRILIKNS